MQIAAARLFKEAVTVVSAGRTDAGVHASAAVVSFLAPATFPMDRLPIAMNAVLPRAISVLRADEVADDFSARFAARERRYVYLVDRDSVRCALRGRFAAHEPRRMNVAHMRAGAALLLGRHDFRSFCGTPPSHGGTVRTLRAVTIDELGAYLRFEVRADGFLHRMVRAIVGTLIEVGIGRRDYKDIPAIVSACDRKRAGMIAPACGLFLAGVSYDDFDSFREPAPIAVDMRRMEHLS